jgi:hypothetical protein
MVSTGAAAETEVADDVDVRPQVNQPTSSPSRKASPTYKSD